MDQQNPWGTASLGLGLGTWLVWFTGTCASFVIPFVGTLTYPLTWMMAAAGTISGFVGYRTAMVTDGSGRGASLGGLALNLSWILLQALFLVLTFVLVGTMIGAILVGILADAAR